MKDPRFVVTAGLQVAFRSLQQGNFSAALEVVSLVLEADPDNVAALSLSANAHAQSHLDPEAALVDAARVQELVPDSLEFFKPRILALLQLERVEEVEAALDELGARIAKGEGDSALGGWHCATVAIFAEESDEPEKAHAQWETCLERYPADPNVVTDAVAFFEKRRDLQRTIEILRTALREGDAVGGATLGAYRVSLAERLIATGAVEEAEAVLVEASQVEEAGTAAANSMDLARHYDRRGETGKALEASERSLSLAREVAAPSPDHLLEVADIALRAGERERALALAGENPVPAHAALIRARVAHAEGRLEEALRLYDDAGRLWPNNPYARYHAARAAESLGRFDAAIELYRHASRIQLDATDSRARAALLLDAQGEPAEALETLVAQSGRAPLSAEEELVALRLRARSAPSPAIERDLPRVARLYPGLAGEGLAAVAEGLRERNRKDQAVALLAAQGEALSNPIMLPALRKWVELAAGTADLAEAGRVVRAGREARPESAALREVEGMLLEAEGGSTEAARSAYARALELDPTRGLSLARAGRLALASDPDAGLALLERAIAADGAEPATLRRAAAELAHAERGESAERLLEAVLDRVPYDREAALGLARMRLARGVHDERTLELATRAGRFGAGPPAYDLLQRVHVARGESAEAERAGESAQILRDRLRAREMRLSTEGE
jgi:tetratricopeptide (TPR) repeat protein